MIPSGETIPQALTRLELAAAEIRRMLEHEPRHPEMDPGQLFATPVVIRSLSGTTMQVQRIKYKDNPPQEGRIEPVGDRFTAYPIPGYRYQHYTGLGMVIGGSDSGAIGATDPTALVWNDAAGNPCVYPMWRGDATAFGQGPQYPPRQTGRFDLFKRVDLTMRRDTQGTLAVLTLFSLNVTLVGAFNNGRPARLRAGFALDRRYGTLRARVDVCNYQHLGGFRYWAGGLYAPMHGTVCGRVVSFTTGGACIPVGAGSDCACGVPEPDGSDTCDTDPPGHDPLCFEPGGLNCIYCLEPEDQCVCTIHQARPGCLPCGAYGSIVRAIAPPGIRVTPVTMDVLGNKFPFHANAPRRQTDNQWGLQGEIRYYQGDFRGWFAPVFPDPTYGGGFERGDCCTWACNHVLHHGDGAWRVVCTEVLQRPPPEQPRPFHVLDVARFPAICNFWLSRIFAGCFRRLDQSCFTAGPDPDGDWDHLSQGDPRLGALDSMAFDLRASMGVDNERWPHRSPGFVPLANLALDALSDNVAVLTSPGHLRLNGVSGGGINRWIHNYSPSCSAAPVVAACFVRPYGTTCDLPADLVVQSAIITLRASCEPKGYNQGISGFPDDAFDFRVVSTVDIVITLAARIRPGFEDVGTQTKAQAPPLAQGGITVVGVLTAAGVDWGTRRVVPNRDQAIITNALDEDGISVPAANATWEIRSVAGGDLELLGYTAGAVTTCDYQISGPGCIARFRFAGGEDPDPCDLRMAAPHTRVEVFTKDQDGERRDAPLEVRWRGMLGNRPWSLLESPFQVACDAIAGDECCKCLWALDGSVITAEPWEVGAPPAEPQFYGGDAVIMINDDLNEICDCSP